MPTAHGPAVLARLGTANQQQGAGLPVESNSVAEFVCFVLRLYTGIPAKLTAPRRALPSQIVYILSRPGEQQQAMPARLNGQSRLLALAG
jgi:hypothetical protein